MLMCQNIKSEISLEQFEDLGMSNDMAQTYQQKAKAKLLFLEKEEL